MVPGCGSGYDCFYLADSGFLEVIGLDISPTATAVCVANMEKQSDQCKAACRFEVADFFSKRRDAKKMDFIFDYLFFAALDKPMRALWAQSMAALLKPNSGQLATLMFPVDEKMDPNTGPPYPVTLADFKAVLEPMGFSMEFHEKVMQMT